MQLDSSTGTAPNLIGKDNSGNWHVYQIPTGGGGTITNLATGYGLSGGPITNTGTIIVDSAALHLKFLGLADSTIYYPYASNPKNYLTATNGWSVTGNAGTTSSNFIGTTDNIPLQFKVNNVLAGSTGTGGFLSNASFGALSLPSTSTGNSQTAFGSSALHSNTTGSRNVAVGYTPLYYNKGGNDNTAIGWSSQGWDSLGVGNTSVGSESMNQYGSGQHIGGSYNSALGFGALGDNWNNNYNIGIGHDAGLASTKSNTFYVSDSTYHMFYKLDSAAGTPPSVVGKDGLGFWHVYQTPSGGGGGGTVTNLITGYGLSGGPITTTGTITVDSAALHLNFLGLEDSTVYYPYASNPKGYITTMQDDGTALPSRTTLNFNYGVKATDNSGSSRTDVDVNLTTGASFLASDVTMSSASTFYDGGSVSLTAGTWMVTSTGTIESTSNNAMRVTGKVWDGTTVYAASEGSVGAMGGGTKGYVNLSMSTIITLSSTTTVKISCTSTIANCSLKATPADNNSGTTGKATSITAIRIK